MMMKRKTTSGWMSLSLSLSLLAALGLRAQVSEGTPGWAVFDVPGLEAPAGTPVDLSFLNEGPAGAHGFVRVENGRFMDDRNVPLRLYGTNLTGDACFPEPEDGRRLAVRLRQLGFNCLRLHFMDTAWHKDAIWKDSARSEMSEENLRKLDAFVAACIGQGIWCNVNLHVARVYPGAPSTFTMGKNMDRWYEPYIRLQEDYARKLMGRVNTVTGLRYAETPGILCVEINNENTMVTDERSRIAELPQQMRDSLTLQWTAWLRRKYGSDEALRQAWEAHFRPLGETIVSDRGTPWHNENAGGSASTVTATGGGAHLWKATRTGNAEWNLQLQLRDFRLPEGVYTVSFEARSASSSLVTHRLMLNAAPWQDLGLAKTLRLTPEWQTFEIFGRVPKAVNDKSHRVNFSLNNRLGEMEIRNYTIRPGGGRTIFGTQSVSSRVELPSDTAYLDDYFEFLIDTEMATTRRLRDLLKRDLGCRMPVTDSQVNYGSIGGLRRETELSDFIDIHTYWEHPSYSKDAKGRVERFSIRNTPQVANGNGGCVANLSTWRVDGMPFSVSEYNAPAPNDHSADMFPIFSVIASIQDWDAFYSYTYRDFGRDYANTFIRGYFQLIGRANLLVHLPFAVRLFRERLMPPAANRTVLAVPRGRAAHYASMRATTQSLFSGAGGVLASAISQRLANRLVDDLDQPTLLEGDGKPIVDPDGAIRSSDGSYRTRPDDPDGAWATLNLPSARLLTGSVGGRAFQVGDVSIAVDARDWPHPGVPAFACISLIALDGRPVADSRRLLLAASARTENTGMKWNGDRTSLVPDGTHRGHWGKPPVLSEMVPATVRLPGSPRLRLTVLDPLGQPAASRDIADGTVRIGAEDRSLWFLIER